jgi:hypothetical protein
MISYHKESLCDVIAEVEPLLQLHYEELTLNKDRVKLDPDWQRYAELEHAGGFHVFTARDGDKLVGYSAFFLNTHIHYRGLMLAQNDVLYLHPEHRLGLVGVKLIKMSHSGMKKLGADKIVWHCKHSNQLKRLLLRLFPQYRDEESSVGGML